MVVKKLLIKKRKVISDKEFEILIVENKLSLYKVAKGMLKKEDIVQDAIQSAVLKAYENLNKLNNAEFFKTWLIRILINECKNILKRDRKIILLEDEIINKATEDTYKNIDLERAINNLDDDLKEVTVLYYFDDILQKDIAEILDINESTVRTRLLRARKKLFEILRDDERYGGQ